jgi:nucleoside-diphosphate-sugar epimerase
MVRNSTALVVGAAGGIGSEVAAALLRRGWTVKGLVRDPAKAAERGGGIAFVAGDALRRDDVIKAATGAAVIVHAVNPPGYRNWAGLALPMLESTIAAAEASGARIVFPGTIYNFGPDAFPRLFETSPQNPETRKGRIRVTMEAKLEAAATRGVRSLIVRAGDFFGPHAGNNWFGGGLIKPGRPVTRVLNPGAPGVGHAWAYLPDLAETMARLIEREGELAPFERFHFAGHWLADNAEMGRAIGRAVGNPRLPIRPFPWWAMGAAAPFMTLAYELQEMRYLWKTPIALDNGKLVAFLGEEPHTPLDQAVETTLRGLGCLPAEMAKALAKAA